MDVSVTRGDSRARYVDDLRPTGDVFLMTRFFSKNLRAHCEMVQVLQEELEGYGLRLTQADWKQFHDELWTNVCHYMDNAQFGIAIFDKFDEASPSLNVSLELGYTLAKDKRCLLLRDKRVSMLQADLAGHLCHEFDPDNIRATVRSSVHAWLRDLGISKRPGEHLVFFVSSGGTCREAYS
jgi:nucleoside 2-deoxyribosyltransferase